MPLTKGFAVPNLPPLVYAMLLAPLALILIAAIVKTWQAREARSWPQVSGKVVTSVAELREVRVSDDEREDGYRMESRNFANVAYEYSVSGRKLSCNRISIGEDLGNFQVAEKLAKYPAGSIVTVYYNPRHPDQAVLERDLPKGLWGCLGIGTAIVVAIIFGSVIGLTRLSQFFATHIADPKLSPMVVGFCAFAFAIALFALALQRQAQLSRRWPVVSGTIKTSDLGQYRDASSEGGARGQQMFERQVSYAYSYHGVHYSNVHARYASNVASDTGWLMRKFTTNYKDGAAVKVYVNPDNPSEATMDPRASFVWVLWVCVAGFAAGAYFFATHG